MKKTLAYLAMFLVLVSYYLVSIACASDEIASTSVAMAPTLGESVTNAEIYNSAVRTFGIPALFLGISNWIFARVAEALLRPKELDGFCAFESVQYI